MPIHDSDSDRRNLVVTSFAFIAYYWGGGKLISSDLHLQFINIKFSRPEVLAFFAWFSLLWFAYRYVVTRGDGFIRKFDEQFDLMKEVAPYKEKLREECLRKLRPLHENEEYFIDDLKFRFMVFKMRVTLGIVQSRNDRGVVTAYIPLDSSDINISSFFIYFKSVYMLGYCFFMRKPFSENLFPYIVFFVAIFGPLANKILS